MAEVFVRRNAWDLPAGDPTLEAYGRAVGVMRGRDDDDPTSWAYQAKMHGSPTIPPGSLWNQCEHQSWFFVVWHRMYLHYFEELVRAAVIETGGPEDWALPYWNYELGGEKASLPKAFRNPENEDGSTNFLFVSQRAPGANQGGRIPAQSASAAKALARPNYIGMAEFGGGEAPPHEQFWGQAGTLEMTPHNAIHNLIGGGTGWMGDPDLAALDPIFWLHHANIDRLWAEWQAVDGHDDPSESDWTGQKYEFFDTDGNKVSKTSAEAVSTVEDFGYTYDPAPGGATPEAKVGPSAPMPDETPPDPKFVGATEKTVTLTGDAARIPVEIDQRANEEAAEASRRFDPRHVYLNLEDIEAERNPGSVYGIYVNLPEDPSPEQLEAHHAGNLSFFGIERTQDPRKDEHPHKLRISVEVGGLLDSVSEEGWDGQKVDVALLPLGLLPPEGASDEVAREMRPSGEDPPVHLGRISVAIQ
jgi:tyrosinase